jgi:hypothetical protein
LSGFKPQNISNIVWAYTTASESYPQLFKKVADHIVAQSNLSGFKPQEISNIIWAYTTAGETHPLLIQKLADVAITKRNNFNPQSISNFLWAYATMGQMNRHLFLSFAQTVKSIMGKCNNQHIANIGWAYSVANVDAPLLFNADFICVCLEKENDFVMENLCQLHQWPLWQEELKSDIRLPQSLREMCQKAFLSRLAKPSRLQDDVISVLASMGLQPEEEVLTKSGYRTDALVEANEKKIGIEVDGPSHSVGRKPTGSTLLKHRQVNTLDEIQVVSVPYWEWNKLGKDGVKKQQYFCLALGFG